MYDRSINGLLQDVNGSLMGVISNYIQPRTDMEPVIKTIPWILPKANPESIILASYTQLKWDIGEV